MFLVLFVELALINDAANTPRFSISTIWHPIFIHYMSFSPTIFPSVEVWYCYSVYFGPKNLNLQTNNYICLFFVLFLHKPKHVHKVNKPRECRDVTIFMVNVSKTGFTMLIVSSQNQMCNVVISTKDTMHLF